MTTRTPLVLVNGQIQQLQAGDSLAGGSSSADDRSLTNGESATALVIGMAVYASAAGAVKRGQANAMSTSRAVGLVVDTTIAAAAAGYVRANGILSATTAQWDAVTGQTGGLTFGAAYYLDAATAGKITATSPSATGQVVTQIGVALSTTEMDIAVQPPILL